MQTAGSSHRAGIVYTTRVLAVANIEAEHLAAVSGDARDDHDAWTRASPSTRLDVSMGWTGQLSPWGLVGVKEHAVR